MATKSQNKSNARWTVQVLKPDGKRTSIRIGKMSVRHAEKFRSNIEELERTCHLGQSPSQACIAWVKSLGKPIRQKIAATGLIEAERSTTLAELIDQYIDNASVKDSTLTKFRSSSKHLLEYFGKERDPRAIDAGEARDWHTWMLKKRSRPLAPATAAKSVKHAKQFMAYAIDKRLLESDPFAKLSGSCSPNRDRDFYLTREDTQRVLEACPDVEWRLLVALARFGGLRTPSEPLQLKWTDIDWDRSRFLVRSPKTKHHADGGHREVPIFPELFQHLLDAYEQAEESQPYVISRYRDPAVNLRTQFERIIHRAGLKPWPKLWQNLRSTRQTELCKEFPLQCVTAWLGNSPKVAMDHYLQVTEEHFQKAVQNPVQTVHAGESTQETGTDTPKTQAPAESAINADMQGLAFGGDSSQKSSDGPGGTRTESQNSGDNANSDRGGAESGAIFDKGLLSLVQKWGEMSEEVKNYILEISRMT